MTRTVARQYVSEEALALAIASAVGLDDEHQQDFIAANGWAPLGAIFAVLRHAEPLQRPLVFADPEQVTVLHDVRRMIGRLRVGLDVDENTSAYTIDAYLARGAADGDGVGTRHPVPMPDARRRGGRAVADFADLGERPD